MSDPRPILDYSSLSDERKRELSEEEKRREAIENYNESTVGERRPIVAALVRLGTLVFLMLVVGCVLPHGVAKVLIWVAPGAFLAREIWARRWPTRSFRRGTIFDQFWRW